VADDVPGRAARTLEIEDEELAAASERADAGTNDTPTETLC
jgi:hypothetical protein